MVNIFSPTLRDLYLFWQELILYVQTTRRKETNKTRRKLKQRLVDLYSSFTLHNKKTRPQEEGITIKV